MAHGPQHHQVFVRIKITFLLGALQDLHDKGMNGLLILQKTRVPLENRGRHFTDKPELLRVETGPVDIGDGDCLKLIDG